MSAPATCAVPEVGTNSVVSILIVVLLPAPFGPRSPKMVDAGTAMVTASTATSAPKWRVRRVVSMAGVVPVPLDMKGGLSGGTTRPDGDLGPATGGRLGRRRHPQKERLQEEPGVHIPAQRVFRILHGQQALVEHGGEQTGRPGDDAILAVEIDESLVRRGLLPDKNIPVPKQRDLEELGQVVLLLGELFSGIEAIQRVGVLEAIHQIQYRLAALLRLLRGHPLDRGPGDQGKPHELTARHDRGQ